MDTKSWLLRSYLFLFLAKDTFTLTLPLSNAISKLPNASTSSSGEIEEFFTAQNGFARDYDLVLPNINAAPVCDGAHFGHDIARSSCNDALGRLVVPARDPMMHFGQRGHWAGYQNKLPIRFLSSWPGTTADGLCAIDIVHAPGKTDDGARVSQILDAAHRISVACLGKNGGIDGGYVGKLGIHGDLGVIVRNYQPRVECRVPPGEAAHIEPFACQPILQKIPVTTNNMRFGTFKRQGAQVLLPKYFPEVATDCAGLLTGSDDRPYTSSFYDIWAGLVAVNALCVRQGRLGFSNITGDDHGSLNVALVKLPWAKAAGYRNITGSNSGINGSSGLAGNGDGSAVA